MPEKDVELEQALKQARAKKMFFAFVPKGSDGKLIVSKRKILPKAIAEAKKEIGGGTPVTGKCFGPVGNLVFQVVKPAPATMEAALKKVAHRDAGLTVVPHVQLAADADAEDEAADDAGVAAAGPTDTGGAGAAAGLAEFTTRLKALMPAIQAARDDPAAPVKVWAREAATLAGKHDVEHALALLDRIDAALKAMPAVAATAPPVLQSITISPANAALIGGWQRQFKAIGAYSSGPSRDLTTEVAWSSSPADVVPIDNKGLASPQRAAGNATITARATDPSTRATVTATTKVTVTPDPTPTMSPDEESKAEVFADMSADLEADTPNVAALKELAAKPGNAKILDQLVESLDENTSQKVLEAAIEARFGIKVEQYEHQATGDNADVTDLSGATAVSPNLPDKSLKRVYELMTKVPSSHVTNNPKLTEIVRFTKDKYGGAYGGDKVYLYCGRADNTQPYQLAKPSELPTVEDNCKPKDDKKPDYFDFAVLHEVGHSVDAKNSFMIKHLNKPDFGGWQSTNPGDIAKIADGHFHFGDEGYIKTKLSGGTPTPPAKAEKAVQDKVDAWCDGIRLRKGYELWRDAAGTSALAIGNTVYQQAYAHEWWSYDLAARKKGITGYQFRAPWEWFAELYAAFQSGKLQDSHPSISWLKTL